MTICPLLFCKIAIPALAGLVLMSGQGSATEKRHVAAAEPDHRHPDLLSASHPVVNLSEGLDAKELRITPVSVVFGNSQGEMKAQGQCGPSPFDPAEIRALVISAAHRHGVDPVLAEAIAFVESGFDRSRNSPKGARGPMQLMPATADRFKVEDICDPIGNIEAGIRYLRVLQDEFRNPLLVAAAYNSGEARIHQYGGVPPFVETVRYVARVVNYQLDLPDVKSERSAPLSPLASSHTGRADEDTGLSGRRLFAGDRSGRFVGGVMHFQPVE